MVWNLGIGVWGSGFWVRGLGFGVYGLRSGVEEGFGFKIQDVRGCVHPDGV